MKFVVSFFFGLLCANGTAQTSTVPSLSSQPVGPVRLAIYRSFLTDYDDGEFAKLNLAQSTIPFKPEVDDRYSYLRAFRWSALKALSLHTFNSDTFPDTRVTLVDPKMHHQRDPGDAIRHGQPVDQAIEAGIAAGVFTFSEIVFDASHQHAAFSYSLVCGGLCGHGVVVYQLHHKKMAVG